MALRVIREIGDEILTKKAKEVKDITPRTSQLILDMIETMHEYDGVGLAAPQVGVLKRIIVVDVGEGAMVMVNPEIIEQSGEQTGPEGCLSVPGKKGIVTRPAAVTVKCLDENMMPRLIKGEELLARAICHECDHLEGKMYVDLVEGELMDVTDDDGEEEEEE